MTQIRIDDPDLIRKMYQYNRNFRDYVNHASRSGLNTKEQVMSFAITRSVCCYYHDISNGVEDEESPISYKEKEPVSACCY